jgi:hypothetical protein
VVDASTHVIGGILIASSPGSGISWMLPAYQIFADVLRAWQVAKSQVQGVFRIPEEAPPPFLVAGASKVEPVNVVAGESHKDIQTLKRLSITNDETGPPKKSTFTSPSKTQRPLAMVFSEPSEASSSMTRSVSDRESSKTSHSMLQPLPHSRLPSSSDLKENLGLSPLAFRFVELVDSGKRHEEFLLLIKQHPEILAIPRQDLIEAARTAASFNQGSRARNCLKCAIMLEACQQSVGDALDEYFRLISEDPPTMAEFYDGLDKLKQKVLNR